MNETHELTVAGVTVELIVKDDSIVTWLRKGEPFENETLETWARLCARGGTVLDVGAYTGLFSIVAAKLGCHVITFEPMPKNRARCAVNMALNGVTVDLHHACVSDSVGTATIKFNPRVPFLTSGASLVRPSGGSESQDYKVPSVTIDSLELSRCDVIKIDVERGEPLVLRGAAQTLERCRPLLLVEVLGKAEEDAVTAAVPGYRVVARLDDRNWYMAPR